MSQAFDDTVRVFKASGESAATIPSELVSDARSLKKQLQKLCGVPRFRQRLLQEGRVLEGAARVSSGVDVQLVVLPFTSEWVDRADAVGYESLETVERQLQYPCDPNMRDDDGIPCLHYAARRGDVDIVLLLLEAEADLDKEDLQEGITALYVAAMYGRLEAMRVLLDAGADKAKAVRCVCRMMGRVSQHFEDLDVKSGRWALQQLLQAQADLNLADTSGRTPLHLLCARGVPGYGTRGLSEVAGWLLKVRASPSLVDNRGNTALHEAAASNLAGAVQRLLKAGAGRDAVNNVGQTPLVVAAISNSFDVARVLVLAGADTSLADRTGKRATEHSSTKAMRKLLAN
ncbi:secG [Symbiodinium microadriaticum]|nr:secG [Symbiodinium microadriaticum]